MQMLKAMAVATVVCLTVLAAGAAGDTLVLRDGTKIEGRVVPQSDKYWIKTASGETRTIPKSQVAEWQRAGAAAGGGASPGSAAPATPGAAAPPAGGGGAGGGPTAPLGFAQTKSKADRVDAPLVAIGLWQNFIDHNPASPELPAAKTELAKWQQLDKDKAEKINGKWVGGEERKKIVQKVKDLLREADQMADTQQLKAVAKLEEAVRLYPNSFEANFELGYLYLVKAGSGSLQKHDQSIKSLETATKLRPNSAQAWSNLGIAYNFRQRYQESVMACYKAAQIRDNKEIAQNLVNSIAQAPPGMRENNSKVRPIMEEAVLLARKHGIGDGKQNWIFIRRGVVSGGGAEKDKGDGKEAEQDTTPGVIGNGSGFLVSADGYLITNKHVAGEKDCTFIVRFSDGTQKPAEVIALDDDADLALMKIKSDKPLPFLQFAQANEPGVGAECVALGFPVGSVMNYTMQVTAGTVSSVSANDEYPVTLTAKITHGNSGGPLVDKFGNVIGVVSAGLTAYTETYGKALSPGQVRKFIEENKSRMPATLAAGATKERLDTEGIYKKANPATVCILLIRGEAKAGE